jgi:hypothetical protein
MKDYGLQWMVRDKKERWFKEIKKTLKMIICRRNKLYADDKTVVLRFLDCRKIYCKVYDFFYPNRNP